VDRVVVVVLLDVVAAETFDVEEGAVEELELLAGMVCALGKTWRGVSWELYGDVGILIMEMLIGGLLT
jgi:hypothetical protein